MKLKDGFITHDVAGMHITVATGNAADALNGLLRTNDTAGRIVELLMKETTEDSIVKTMCEEYNAPEEEVSADVHMIIQKLRDEGLLDE